MLNTECSVTTTPGHCSPDFSWMSHLKLCGRVDSMYWPILQSIAPCSGSYFADPIIVSIWQSWLFIFRLKLPRRLDVDRTDFFPPNFVSARNSELQLEGMGNLITKSLIGLRRRLCFFLSVNELSRYTDRISLFAVLHESGDIHRRTDVRIDWTSQELERVPIKRSKLQLSQSLVGFFAEQVEAINCKELGDHITNLKRVGTGHGEYHFDRRHSQITSLSCSHKNI